jgi:hypothetical protein
MGTHGAATNPTDWLTDACLLLSVMWCGGGF